jgi:acid phosphatase family membrane protein YuiD
VHFISPYILAAIIAWIVAQGLKYIVASVKGRKLNSLKQLYLSGSMPSAHSASVIALLVVIGFKDGVDSAIFGLALLFAAVVMYDAIMVRRSSGEQGNALMELFASLKQKTSKPFRIAKGHTPAEVAGGIVVGLVVGSVVYFTTIG